MININDLQAALYKKTQMLREAEWDARKMADLLRGAAGITQGFPVMENEAYVVDRALMEITKDVMELEEKVSQIRKRNQELICKGWFLPPNTYDCGSFVVN